MLAEHNLDRKMLSQIASDQLKQFIADNRLKPGDQLPTERELAERMQVSRPVVREALNRLETLQLIVKVQGKGIFVAEQNLHTFFEQIVTFWDSADMGMEKLLAFRLMLEQAAMEEIAEQAVPEDYGRLEAMVKASAEPAIDEGTFVRMDADFHAELIRLTGNELFHQLSSTVARYFAMLQLRLPSEEAKSGADRARTIADHRKLIGLLSAKQVKDAKQLLKEHLLDTGTLT